MDTDTVALWGSRTKRPEGGTEILTVQETTATLTRVLGYLFLATIVTALAGCGGGSTAMPEQPEPLINPALGQIAEWRSNPLAEDLLDRWNDPEVL